MKEKDKIEELAMKMAHQICQNLIVLPLGRGMVSSTNEHAELLLSASLLPLGCEWTGRHMELIADFACSRGILVTSVKPWRSTPLCPSASIFIEDPSASNISSMQHAFGEASRALEGGHTTLVDTSKKPEAIKREIAQRIVDRMCFVHAAS